MNSGDDNKYFKTVCYTEIAGKRSNGECDVFFKDGKAWAVIHNYGSTMETTELDPRLLKPSPDRNFDLVYLGVIYLSDPQQQ
jgi:hypothetical protein